MREITPGHIYKLMILDGLPHEAHSNLIFVKREGAKFPGNRGHHSGTNMQEVLRAVLARISYLDNQEPYEDNKLAAGMIGQAIWIFEKRAAERHGRPIPTKMQALFGRLCTKCGHVGCEGGCHG